MSVETSPLMTEILSRSQVFPTKKPETPRTVPLSIIDSTVAYYGPTTAIWFFEKPSITIPFSELTAQLKTSLSTILSIFPHFSGLLHYTSHEPNGSHTHRYRRLAITYGKSSDPGVEFVAGKYVASLESLVPSAAIRRSGNGCWDGTHIPVEALIPPRTHMSLCDLNSTDQILPCFLTQITQFTCGGIAIAARCSHPVGDSISLVYFVNCWAKIHRELLQREIPSSEWASLLESMPVFDPGLLAQSASGDIDAQIPDPELVEKALEMPMHRFDSWNQESADGNPHNIPKDFDPATIELGTPPPKDEPNPGSEISFCVLHFTHQEIESIWKAATTVEAPVSHHDALCAHIWILINRSRGLENDKGEVHLDFTIGLRTRTSPPLPSTFLGSPLVIGDVALPSHSASSQTSLPHVASKIRSTIVQFSTENVGAILHHRAFEESPQRYYHSSTGLRHTIQTSWMNNDSYEIDFGTGAKLRYTMAAMAMIDGFVQTMESAPLEEGEVSSGKAGASGVDVAVRVKKETMQRLLVDPLLRRYRG